MSYVCGNGVASAIGVDVDIGLSLRWAMPSPMAFNVGALIAADVDGEVDVAV